MVRMVRNDKRHSEGRLFGKVSAKGFLYASVLFVMALAMLFFVPAEAEATNSLNSTVMTEHASAPSTCGKCHMDHAGKARRNNFGVFRYLYDGGTVAMSATGENGWDLDADGVTSGTELTNQNFPGLPDRDGDGYLQFNWRLDAGGVVYPSSTIISKYTPDGTDVIGWDVDDGDATQGNIAWATTTANGTETNDSTPPAAIDNLRTNGVGTGVMNIVWTAPGDDGSTGTPHSYDIRFIDDGNAGASSGYSLREPADWTTMWDIVDCDVDDTTGSVAGITTAGTLGTAAKCSNGGVLWNTGKIGPLMRVFMEPVTQVAGTSQSMTVQSWGSAAIRYTNVITDGTLYWYGMRTSDGVVIPDLLEDATILVRENLSPVSNIVAITAGPAGTGVGIQTFNTSVYTVTVGQAAGQVFTVEGYGFNLIDTAKLNNVAGAESVTCAISGKTDTAMTLTCDTSAFTDLTYFDVDILSGTTLMASWVDAIYIQGAAAAPTLTSPTATSITNTTATLGANITSDGGDAITARGTCWGTTANPLTNCVAEGGTATGVFTQARTTITAGTKIFYRGYATNGTGTSYSSDGSFYTEAATQASAVNFTGVGSSGMTVNWTRGNGTEVIVLMKQTNPVDSDPVDGTYSGYTANAAFASGTQLGTGNYVIYKGTGTSVPVTALSGSTTYQVAVYELSGALDTAGVDQASNYKLTAATGSQATSAGASPPTLTSPTATSITSTTATLGANITADGGAAITEHGTCWATTANPVINCTTLGAVGTGVFTDARTTITAGTKIYYRGYATNSAGTSYSADGSFYTEAATQASAVNFTGVGSSGMTVNWTRGNGTEVIVLMKQTNPVDSDPVDGTYTGYTANAAFASGTQLGTGNYVIYKGTATSVPVTALSASTTYQVAVYEVSGALDTAGVDQASNYKLTPATGSQATSAGASPPLNVSGPALSLTATATEVDASFSINSVFDDNGSAIASCDYSINNGGAWTGATVSGSGATTNCDVSSVTCTDSASLDILMRATNAGGTTANTSINRTCDDTAIAVTSTIPVDAASNITLNQQVTINFNDDVLCATVDTTNITSDSPGWALSSCSGTQAIFDTLSQVNSTTYRYTVTTAVTDTVGNAVAADDGYSYTTKAMVAAYVSSYTTTGAADLTPPTVFSTDPTGGATNVAVDGTVTVVFDEAIDCTTINTTNITSDSPGWTYNSDCVTNTVTFSTSGQSNLTIYRFTITTNVTDVASNAIAADDGYSYTTAPPAPSNVSGPTLSNTATATEVDASFDINSVFDANGAAISSCDYSINNGGAWTGATVSGSGAATNCDATSVTCTDGASIDILMRATNAGGTTQNTSINRTCDDTAIAVTSTTPVDGAPAVAVNQQVIINFNDDVLCATVNTTNITSDSPGWAYNSCSGTQAIFDTSGQANSTTYSFTITMSVTDTVGNAMASADGRSYTTAAGATAPVLTSPTAITITNTTATLGANITSDGGDAITEHGTCWDTTANPTANCSTLGAVGTGVFTDARTTITAGTKIFYRGYATNGIGTSYSPDGSFYTEAATQASAVNFTGVGSTDMTVNWTRGNGTEVIVLMKLTNPVDSDPVDGTYSGYTANTAFASGTQLGTGNYVIYKGTGTSVPVTALTASTTYQVAVYEVSGALDTAGVDQASNYKLTPATGSQATGAGASPPLNVSGPALSLTATATEVDASFSINSVFDDNGSAIASCDYSINNGGAWTAATVSGSGATTNCDVSGVTCTDSASLDILMRATNAGGTTSNTSINRTCDDTAIAVTSTIPVDATSNITLNQQVTINFNDDVLCATVDTTNITSDSPGWALSSCSGTQAIFDTLSQVNSTTYRYTVTTAVTDTVGNAVAADDGYSYTTKAMVAAYVSSYTTTGAADLTPPTVFSTTPTGGATGVTLDGTVTVVFDEAIDCTTINTTNITSDSPGWTYNSDCVTNTVTFSTSGQSNSTIYWFTITTNVTDVASNAIAANDGYSYTTAAPAPTNVSGPTLSATATATEVDASFSINSVFNDNGAAISSCDYSINNGGAWTGATVSGSGSTTNCDATGVTCTDAASLDILMRATNAGGTISNTSINRTCDDTAIAVTSTVPADSATGVGLDGTVTIDFNDDVLCSTVNTTNITSDSPGWAYNSCSGTQAIFDTSGQANGTTYRFTVTTSVTDTVGNAMASADGRGYTTVALGAPNNVSGPTLSNTATATEVDASFSINSVFDDTGAAISSCDYSINNGGAWTGATVSGSGATTNCDVTGVTCTDSASLDILMRATNGGGTTSNTSINRTCDDTAIAVSSTNPADSATGVTLDQQVTINFNDDVLCSTVNTTNITSDSPGWAYSSCSGTQAIFDTSGQANSTTYRFTVTTSVTDTVGNAMASADGRGYTTAAAAAPSNISGPTLSNTATATEVDASFDINSVFDDNGNAISSCDYSINNGGAWTGATVSGSGATTNCDVTGVTCTDSASLDILMRATNIGGTTSNTSINRTCDDTAIAVTSTVPVDSAVDIALDQTVTINFNDDVLCSTVNTTNITSDSPGWTYNSCTGTQAIFNTSGQASSTTYWFTVTTNVTDTVGNAMASAVGSGYTTIAVAGPATYYLHDTASNLAGSWQLLETAPSAQNDTTTVKHAKAGVGAFQFQPGVTDAIIEYPNTNPPSNADGPSGLGWLIDTYTCTADVAAGDWTFTLDTTDVAAAGTGFIYARAWDVAHNGTNITASTPIFNWTTDATDIMTAGNTQTTITVPDPGAYALTNQYVYVEFIVDVTVKGNGGNTDAITFHVENANTTATIPAISPCPIAPSTVSGPTLSATATATEVDASFSINSVFDNNGFAIASCDYSINNGGAWTGATVSGGGATTNCDVTGVTCTDAASLDILMRATNAGGTTSNTSINRTCDDTAIAVSSTTPVDGATGVSLDQQVTINFNDDVECSTVTIGNITSDSPGWAVSSCSGTTAIFDTASQAGGVTYWFTVTTNVTDTVGNAMATADGSSYTTAVAPPTVVSGPTLSATATATEVDASFSINSVFNDVGTMIDTCDYSLNNGGAWTGATVSGSGATTNCDVTGVTCTDGASLDIGMRATSSQGTATTSYINRTCDDTAIAVTSTTPADSATGVAVDSQVTIEFNDDVDCTTVNTTNITGDSPGWALNSCSGSTAVFDTSGQAYLTTYNFDITTNVTDTVGNAMASTDSRSYTTSAQPPSVVSGPTITSTIDSGTEIDGSFDIGAVFNTNGSVITSCDYSLNNGAGWTGATVSGGGATRDCDATGVTCADGVAMDILMRATNAGGTTNTSAFSRSCDAAAIAVSSTIPVNGAPSVTADSNVVITFNDDVECSTVSTTNITSNSPGWTLDSCAGTQATFTTSGQATEVTYLYTIKTNVTDTVGNAMASVDGRSYTTAPPGDFFGPVVQSTTPTNGATNIALNGTVTVVFNEDLDCSTVTANTISSDSPGWTYNNDCATNTVTFTTSGQDNSTTYRFTVLALIRDLVGNIGLEDAYSYTTVADTTPPNAVTDMEVNTSYARGLMVKFTPPGDDGSGDSNPVVSYDIRYIDAEYYPVDMDTISEFNAIWGDPDPLVVLHAAQEPTPVSNGGGGTKQLVSFKCAEGASNDVCSANAGEMTLWPNTLYYVAMQSDDDVPLTSTTSNLTQPLTWSVGESHTGMKYGYNHISIPYDIESVGTSFTTNFQDDVYPGFNSTVYMYTWTPTGLDAGGKFTGSWTPVTRSNALSTMPNGTGFYFYSRGYTNVINVPEATHNANQTATNWVGINLEQGRNLVGNPYLKNVDFSNIKVCKDAGGPSTFNEGTGACGGTLNSFTAAVAAGWVDGNILHYANNSTTATESCTGAECLAMLRPWWGQFVYLKVDSAADTYTLAVPKP